MNIEVENENIKLFRTAYNIAKTNRPYSDYENHITLQTLNGIKLGSTLHSRYSATQIINHIACEMRKMLVAKILSTNSKITIQIDESTTLSNKLTLVIFLKAYLGGESIDYIFFDLCELQCQDSENIEKELLNTLYKHGLNEEYLKENWIAIATDGASVMVGRQSGVVTRLKQKFPKLFAWHCLNHRLELSVGDTIKEVRGINHFKAFLDKLYSLYSQSPKNCRALEEACHELGTRFAKVGRILGVRWISSSFRTIKTVWESYESLHHHFKSSTYLDSTYQGLLRRLESPEFILDLGLMYDTLQEMSMLSLELQSRTTTLQKAEHIIKRTIRVIESFKTSPGEKSLLALEAAENLKKISSKCIIEKLKLRLCTESNEDNEQLIKDISALEPNNFDAENVRYGEVEMRRICRRFNLDEMKCINGLRDFVDDKNNVPETLQPFFRAISTLPCSTAECERVMIKGKIKVSRDGSRTHSVPLTGQMPCPLGYPGHGICPPSIASMNLAIAVHEEGESVPPKLRQTKITREIGISKFSVHRIAKKKLNLKMYKLRKVQLLSTLEICRQLKHRAIGQRWESFLFTDEKLFTSSRPTTTKTTGAGLLRLLARGPSSNIAKIRSRLCNDVAGMADACSKMMVRSYRSRDSRTSGTSIMKEGINTNNTCQKMLEMVEENPNWKEKVITGDETWVYGHDPETKRQSMEWKGKDEPRTKKSRLCKSKNKVFLVTFFDIKGIVHYEYLEEGQTINKDSYLNIMRRVRESIRLKRSEMWSSKNWIIYYDNVHLHPLLHLY
ncbi:hypothetical protein LAZ67_15000351 [Cordylochernes scorpioides]|uniref:Transposase n=1 Tax=Cordylochernes scorpioides TaxID=51811 RepID=A0ABY6L8U2_9ARAC|nr:hypothetical protein LAZ67_15000351 [Cordylochernes scorpioides]